MWYWHAIAPTYINWLFDNCELLNDNISSCLVTGDSDAAVRCLTLPRRHNFILVTKWCSKFYYKSTIIIYCHFLSCRTPNFWTRPTPSYSLHIVYCFSNFRHCRPTQICFCRTGKQKLWLIDWLISVDRAGLRPNRAWCCSSGVA